MDKQTELDLAIKEYVENCNEVKPKDFKNIQSKYSEEKRNVIVIKEDDDDYTDICFVLKKNEVEILDFKNDKHYLISGVVPTSYGNCWFFNISNTKIRLDDHFYSYHNEKLQSYIYSYKRRINFIFNNSTLHSYEIDSSNLNWYKKNHDNLVSISKELYLCFEDEELQKFCTDGVINRRRPIKNFSSKSIIKANYATGLSEYMQRIRSLFKIQFSIVDEFKIDSNILRDFFSVIDNFNEKEKYLDFLHGMDNFFEEHTIYELFNELHDKFFEDSKSFEYLRQRTNDFFTIYNFSPDKTKSGEVISCFSEKDESFKKIDIDYDKVLNQVDGDVFWDSYLRDYSPMLSNYGFFLSGSDVPITTKKLTDGLKNIKTEFSSSKLKEEYEKIIDDAVLNQESFIPPAAVFEINFGPFSSIEVNQIDSEVFFVLRNSTNNFCTAVLSPHNKFVNFIRIADCTTYEDSDEEHLKIVYSIQLVLASIIRDCWVIENKESLFGTRVIKRKIGKKVEKEERIVYLPKIRYSKNPNFEKLESELNYTSRRKHYVAGHLRKSENISEFQKKLARDYGFAVKEGYTFVRPHERGDVEVKLKYRSRSALECLYEVIPNNKEQNFPAWLKFEKDMKRLFRNSHFEVENSSASGYGDGGIDIIIRSKSDPSKIWFVQCKCYSEAVGPAVMRELKGSIVLYCPEANGICVTVSSFSNKAIEAAENPKYNFFLIDKFDLQKYLEKPLSLKNDLESFYS